MRVLVLGANGMLGHVVLRELRLAGHEAHGTHRFRSTPSWLSGATEATLHAGVDLTSDDVITETVRRIHPEVIVNAAGVTKQRSSDRIELHRMNARFPQVLADRADRCDAKVIQVSTDCVFSGHAGPYADTRTPDPVDDYGRSKLAGELQGPHLTIRTSIVGRELTGAFGLLEWFLADNSPAWGYANARFSGVTTPVLARAVVSLASSDASGLVHVSGPTIAKFDLLTLWAEVFEHDRPIQRSDAPVVDRSLLPSDAVGMLRVPDWRTMSEEVASMSGWYSVLRDTQGPDDR